jgi:nitrogen regulatory protein P-II 1
MNVITATIQPCMLNKVTSALETLESFPGMTVMEARRFGRGRNQTERRAPRIDGPGEKVCIEIVTPDEKARQIIETFVRAARTNVSGDGKVFVAPVDSAACAQLSEIQRTIDGKYARKRRTRTPTAKPQSGGKTLTPSRATAAGVMRQAAEESLWMVICEMLWSTLFSQL